MQGKISLLSLLSKSKYIISLIKHNLAKPQSNTVQRKLGCEEAGRRSVLQLCREVKLLAQKIQHFSSILKSTGMQVL